MGCGETLPVDASESESRTQRGSLAGGQSVARVAAGAYHSLALRDDGVVWAWGQNAEGQLGRGQSSAAPQPTPLPLALPTLVRDVAAGAGHSLALDESGRVWAWGRNNRGQVGSAQTGAPVLTPFQVPLTGRFVAIAARADYSLAVDEQGALWAWGQNVDGELGQRTSDTQAHPTPVKVVLPQLAANDPYLPAAGGPVDPQDVYRIASVAAGGHHVLALTRTGRVWAWGRNDAAQVGTGQESATPVLVPTLIRDIAIAKAVAAGEAHSLIYDNEWNGNAWSWGLNTSGQAGRGYVVQQPPLARQFVRGPWPVGNWTHAGGGIAAGDDFSLFIRGAPHGELVAWGANSHGQLGDLSLTMKTEPVSAFRWDSSSAVYRYVEHVEQVAGGARHGLAARLGMWEYAGCPVVWSWGDNGQGQLGTGSLSPPQSTHVQRVLPLRRFYLDADGDGFGNPNQVQQDCAERLPGYVDVALDCDDSRAAISPSAVEVCDGVDNNCNGATDENGCAYWYRDQDGDGYGNPSVYVRSGVQPAGYVSDSSDCDDSNPGIGEPSLWYLDQDGDGFGRSSPSQYACTRPAGYVSDGNDCNDNSAQVHPYRTEVCDGLDNNCNGQTDEGVGSTWYRDADGDGYGNPNNWTRACSRPSGYVADASDCDDTRASVTTGRNYYRDLDGDGYGHPIISVIACTQPAGYVTNAGDCDDNTAMAHPGRTEVCDGIDNNCNFQTDEGLRSTYYHDADGDGWGNGQAPTLACSRPAGYVVNASDCNDSNPSIGEPTVWYLDQDGDGYGHGGHWQYACNRPGGYTNNGIDCHDSNAAINPGQPESCLDTIDNNCDGYTAPYCGGPTNPNPNPCNGDPLCQEP
ncbi:hypothetical protein LXT21_03005 [Myxococcus sp. K38C18041901]|uniref:RCC1 domain-containing protein n=1 Tax=Myxococcus guangdongensis TaxID=2906760 RepID=UPI0020A76528|nr:MopE-related protein [Myxococcus guangdongensis]MCP3057741.1 hypothetical protein [Myxococcus guangdongensis]